MNELPDPLEPLLAAASTAYPEFRAELRTRTSRALGRRRRLRSLGRVASAACVLIGVALVLWVQRRPLPEQQAKIEVRALPPVIVEPPPVEKDALTLEWQAFDSPLPQRSERYLEAGNQYVQEAQDYESALRCYEQALATGGAQVQEINAGDNWLVMALKRDQKRREN
jgi:hypothetical protein